jgi:hypothetical protein
MPSSYSGELRLNLQAAGENPGTWGDIANVNLRLLEDAISGIVNIATTGGDTTLTTVNGTAAYGSSEDQARYAILKVTGVLVSNARIIIPANSKHYIVWNATSGAYTLTVKHSASTGVVVTQGKKAFLFTDGSEVYQAADDVTTAATLTAIAALAVTDNNIIVGNGSTWVAESGATARASLGAAAEAEVLKVGLHSLWIPASAMQARTTNGAAAGTGETATNKVMRSTLDFDAATAEYAQFSFRAPKSWNEASTFTAYFVWSHPATTTNFAAVWGIRALALSNDDSLETAFGSGVTITDTGGTTDDIYHSDVTGAITPSNTPAEGDLLIFEVYRDAAAGGDTLAVDARLHGVMLRYTIDAATDA